jgi:hypothetical protein
MAKSADEARKQNTYKKPSGKKVTVPSRAVSSKQTTASEATLGRAQDTGKGRGPLRGVARRSREGMEFMSDEAMKKKYPSQNVSGARGRARTESKVGMTGKLTPAPTVPIKTRNLGGIAGKGGTNVGGMYRPMGTGGGMNWQNK